MFDFREAVGPVLRPGAAAEALIAAIRESNDETQVVDEGSYLRVLVPHRCTVSVKAVEEKLGDRFEIPGDLEAIMPAFKGNISILENEVTWAYAAITGES